MSIGDAGGHQGWVALDELIRAADSNNHAVPTIADLESSVSNLAAAGLVAVDGAHTRLTPLGIETYRGAVHQGVGHIQRMFALGQAWARAGYPPAAPRSWYLDADTYQQACADYRDWFAAARARLKADHSPWSLARRATQVVLGCQAAMTGLGMMMALLYALLSAAGGPRWFWLTAVFVGIALLLLAAAGAMGLLIVKLETRSWRWRLVTLGLELGLWVIGAWLYPVVAGYQPGTPDNPGTDGPFADGGEGALGLMGLAYLAGGAMACVLLVVDAGWSVWRRVAVGRHS